MVTTDRLQKELVPGINTSIAVFVSAAREMETVRSDWLPFVAKLTLV